MITLSQWLGPWVGHQDATQEVQENAELMLERVNNLLTDALADGVALKINPKTRSWVSGQTLGGFRPSDSTVGARKSKHKTGNAVDIYDPLGELDGWITNDKLVEHGLYREHADHTKGWCHLQDVPPGPVGSPHREKRTFIP